MVATEGATADYGVLDRFVHRLAFASPRLQIAVSELEGDVFGRRYRDIRVERPVFVTGLPRAGSTLLLEILYASGEFASFTYRQMPFLMAPIFWSKLSRRSTAGESRERAHGDGLSIDLDSPEALDEFVWQAFLSERIFDGDRIVTLGEKDVDGRFRDAYSDLIRRIVHLRREGAGAERVPRYLSKNNANIGRLPALTSLFDDGTVLCCFRDPRTHVRSLMHQHERFTRMHEADRFAADYMRWIGHNDFGVNFKPIAFRPDLPTERDGEAFWLRYWCDAYSHALRHATPRVRFFSLENLMRAPRVSLERLADAVGVADRERLVAEARRVRTPEASTRSGDAPAPDGAPLAEAERIYEAMSETCLNDV